MALPEQVACSSANAVSQEELQAAQATFLAGKKLIDDEPDEAVRLLGDALETKNKYYGESAAECAEAYLYYGIALFEQARSASDILGGQLKDSNEKQEMNRDSTTENKNPNASGLLMKPSTSQQLARDAAGGPGVLQQLSGQAEEPAATSEDDGLEASEGDQEEQEEPSQEEEGGMDVPEEADADDMRLAWEMVEAARVIFEKHGTANNLSQVAEVHIALGDISSEGEHFEEAVVEYAQALSHLHRLDPPNPRRCAEVQYKLSLMHTFLDQPEEALPYCNSALENLDAARQALESKMDALPEDAEAEGEQLAGQVAGIEAVMAELQDRTEELQEAIKTKQSMKDALRTAMQMAAGGLPSLADPAAPSSNPAPTAPGLSGHKPDDQVQNLGTVGRGKTRITLQPVQASAGASTIVSSAPVDAKVPPKRSLEDMMGSAGGLVSVGFGQNSISSAVLTAKLPVVAELSKRTRLEPAAENTAQALESTENT